jgi:hypothetical protein
MSQYTKQNLKTNNFQSENFKYEPIVYTKVANKKESKELKETEETEKTENPEEAEKTEPPEETKEENKEVICDEKLSQLLDKDEKLIFSLQLIGSLKKYDKLTEKDGLPCIDDSLFPFITRWLKGDNRQKSASNIFQVVSKTKERICELLEEDYKAKRGILTMNRSSLESEEQKKIKEFSEDRKRLISRYFLSVSQAKEGIENHKETYHKDIFIKNKLSLAINKIEEILEKLRNFR